MPINITIEPILPPKNFFGKKADRLSDVITAALQGDVTTTLVGALRKRSANWSMSPLWSSRVSGGGRITLVLQPTGPGAKLWLWVSGGTKEHDIDPKNRKVLAFNTNPGRKTGPAGTSRYGMDRADQGEGVYAHHVNHPGIEARAFEVDVVDEEGSKVAGIIAGAIASL